MFRELRLIRQAVRKTKQQIQCFGLGVPEQLNFENMKDQQEAVETAHDIFPSILKSYPEIYEGNEDTICSNLTRYPLSNIQNNQPFIPISSKGPWIITHTGAVLFDANCNSGNLIFGHSFELQIPKEKKEMYMQSYTPSLSRYEQEKFLIKNSPYEYVMFVPSTMEALHFVHSIIDKTKDNENTAIIYVLDNYDDTISYAENGYINNNTKNYYIEMNDVTYFYELQNILKDENVKISAIHLPSVTTICDSGISLTEEFYKAVRYEMKKLNAYVILHTQSIYHQRTNTITNSISSLTYNKDIKEQLKENPPDIEILYPSIDGGKSSLTPILIGKNISENASYNTSIPPTVYDSIHEKQFKDVLICQKYLKDIISSPRYTQITQDFTKQLDTFIKCKENRDIISHRTGDGLYQCIHILPPFHSSGTSTSIDNISARRGLYIGTINNGNTNAIVLAPPVTMEHSYIHFLTQNLQQTLLTHRISNGFLPPPITPPTFDFFDV